MQTPAISVAALLAATVAMGLAACSSQSRPLAAERPAMNTQARATATAATEASAPSAAFAPSAPTAQRPAPTTEAGDPFGFNRVHESCNSFSAHITNTAKTAWLDVYVDVKGLGLGPGEHVLPVDGKSVTLAITELASPYEGEWSCTDVGGGPRPQTTARWRATSGELRILLRKPAADAPEQPYDGPFDRVDLELKSVRFVDSDGRDRAVSLRFEALHIGWMPG